MHKLDLCKEIEYFSKYYRRLSQRNFKYHLTCNNRMQAKWLQFSHLNKLFLYIEA